MPRDFVRLSKKAEPDELQQLIRLMVKRIEWMPEGLHRIAFYHLKKEPAKDDSLACSSLPDWFATAQWTDGPERFSVKPLTLRFFYRLNQVVVEATTLLSFGRADS